MCTPHIYTYTCIHTHAHTHTHLDGNALGMVPLPPLRLKLAPHVCLQCLYQSPCVQLGLVAVLLKGPASVSARVRIGLGWGVANGQKTDSLSND